MYYTVTLVAKIYKINPGEIANKKGASCILTTLLSANYIRYIKDFVILNICKTDLDWLQVYVRHRMMVRSLVYR